MENLKTHVERVQWRRNKVMELSSQGNNQTEIARILQVGLGTVNRDLSYLRQQSKISIQKYIDERLPHEYEKCLMGLTAILKESWNISQEPDIERREKIQALSLAKEVYSAKLDLLTNCTVVDDVIKFIDNHKKRKKEVEEAEESESKEILRKNVASYEVTNFSNNVTDQQEGQGQKLDDKEEVAETNREVF